MKVILLLQEGRIVFDNQMVYIWHSKSNPMMDQKENSSREINSDIAKSSSEDKKKEGISFIKDLMQRRIPQILGIYLATSWAIIEFLDWLISRYSISPSIPDFGLIILASMIPTVLMLAYFHGKPGQDSWTKIEKIGIPANILGAIIVLIFLFNGKDLGAATTMISMTNEEGQLIERVVPKTEFRKKIMIYFFENESGDTALNWLSYGITDLLLTDLIQDIYTEVRTLHNSEASIEKIKQAGYQEFVGLPLMLEKEIAEKLQMKYFLTGSFTKQDEVYTVKTKLYSTGTGKLLDQNSFENNSIFELVDNLTVQLKYDLEVPEYHIEEADDLPVSEISTKSLSAYEKYVRGMNELRFNADWETSLSYLDQSVKEDSTFVLAYFDLYLIAVFTNQIEKRAWIFQPLMRHLYKLPEKLQLHAKASYYEYQREFDKQFAVYEMIKNLYPDDINARLALIQFYIIKNQIDLAISEYKYIMELDPERNDILQEIGDLYKGVGDYEMALSYYTRYAEQFPKKVESYELIGGLYLSIGDYEKAKNNFENALLLEPENIQYLLTMADIERESGNFSEALNQYSVALAKSNTPNDKVEVYDKMWNYYNLTGQLKKEKECILLKFNEYEKYMAPMLLNLRRIGEMNRIVHLEEKEAVKKTLDSLSLEIVAPFEKFSSIGYLYYYLEYKDSVNAKKSLQDVEEFIEELNYEMLRFLVYQAYGQLHEHKGEYEEAIQDYKEQAKLQPTKSGINTDIARCYRLIKEFEKAEEFGQKTLILHPFSPKANYEMALVYYEMGKNEKALEHMGRAVRIWEDADPDYEPALKAREKLAEWDRQWKGAV